MLSSSTYRAHIVQSNGALIFAIIALNRLVQVFGFWPLTVIFHSIYVQLAEFLLVSLCSYNIYYVNKGVVDPYFANLHLPYGEHVFNFGPISTILISWFKPMILAMIPSLKASTLPPQPPPTLVNEQKKELTSMQLFERLACSNNAEYPTEPDVVQLPPPSEKMIHGMTPAIQQYLLKDLVTPRLIPSPAELPKLKYTPCVVPPPQPKMYRPRLMWQLNPSEECIEDFRIVQLDGFQKYWSRFGDRCFRSSYDNLTTCLLQRIFIPLRDSINQINSNLNPRYTLMDCTHETGVLEHLIPGINQGSVFTLSEVMRFLMMNNKCTPARNRYIIERITALASNKKMAAFRYTVKVPGMPSDSDIIMHMFKIYLELKEPAAIPPFFDVEIDVFKFLLTYFFITPELEHWEVFKD